MKRIATNIAMGMAALTLAGVGLGCGTARELDAYRNDTQKLLATRAADIKSCYDEALKGDSKLGGTVTVQFVIEKETGTISQAKIDPAQSTAAPALGQCVLRAIDGLRLDPGDRNEGRATFIYEFSSMRASL